MNYTSVSASEMREAVVSKSRQSVAPIAYKLYVENLLTPKEIVERIREEFGVTLSVPTIYRWAKEGIGSNGVPWDDVRSARRAVQVRDDAEARLEELKEAAAEAIELLRSRLRSGKARASFSDLPKIAEFLLAVENVNEDKIQFMQDFTREVARVLIKYIKDARTLAAISTELDGLVADLTKKLLKLK
jgi:hypothetical protein